MDTKNAKPRFRLVGNLCVVGALMAAFGTAACAQDQAPVGQHEPTSSTQRVTVHQISEDSLSATHPSSMNLTYASQHQPKYPPEAIRARHEGTVRVMALIGIDGQVTETKIEQSSGFPELDESAAVTVSGWKFRPAFRDGAPVASWTRVPINFSLPKVPSNP